MEITCQMPDGQLYIFDCEVQNIRNELRKRTPQIPYDNIILIDELDQVYTATSALYQSKRKQIKDKISYKVFDAQQLYREYKGLISIKQNNYEKLLETQQQLKKLDEEIKEKQIQHKTEIQQLSQTNKSQSADILRTKQAEIENKHNKLELDLNQMVIKDNTQNQNIIQLQEENEKLQQKIKEIQNKLNQENTTLNQWQVYSSQLNTQLQQQLQQSQLNTQAYNDFVLNSQNQVQELKEELKNSKKEVGKYTSQLKAEKEQLEKTKEKLSQFETTVTLQNDQMSKQEKKTKKLEDKISDLEKNNRTTTDNFRGATSTVLSNEEEIRRLKGDNKRQSQKINQLEQDNKELLNYKSILEAKINEQTKDSIQLNSNKERLEEKIQLLCEELEKKVSEIEKSQSKLESLQQQLLLQDREVQDLRNQLQYQKQVRQQQELGEQQSQNEIVKLKSQITNLEQQVKDITHQNSENQGIIGQQRKELIENKGEIKKLEIKLDYAKNQWEQKEDQIKKDQAGNEQYKKQMDDVILAKQSEIEQANVKLNIKEQILKKFQKQKHNDIYFDKIIGVMDKVMSSSYQINQFDQDKNVMLDLKEYEIFEIILEYDIANQLLKNNQYFLFEQCLKKYPKGDVTLNRSIQPNAESTFFKGYLSQVTQATKNEFIGNFFLRKELISQTQPFTTFDEATEIPKNNFLCQLLMEKFNKVLKSQQLKEGDYQIARQYVLKLKDKEEFYYCERVTEGEFKKINGGVFQPKVSEIDSYFNAFSNFVYALSNQNYIITHLQICGKQVYDMIVSTTYKGLFSSLDQGQTEIEQFLHIIKSQPASVIQSFWNANVEAKAKEGFK